MQGLSQFWAASDGVGRAVALLLLAMSVSAWVLILWKGWVLRRVAGDIARAVPAFWDAATVADGRSRLAALDRESVLLPLLEAAAAQPLAGTLETSAEPASQLTRRLRDALHRGLAHLQFGQVVLASVGSTAPFVGLLGTVWAIYHALVGIAAAGSVTVDKVSGPIGEALIMTAAGIAVAVPAVLAYNVFGKWVAACEAELEGFAHDLREIFAPRGEGHLPPAGLQAGERLPAARGRLHAHAAPAHARGGARSEPANPDPEHPLDR